MGTSLTTTNNGFRYPAGLVGEAPDVPDDIEKLASDIDGALGPWTPYNPSFSNVGGITAAGEYVHTSRQVRFMGTASFTSSATVGGLIGMSLPVARRGATLPSGRVLIIDTGVNIYELVPILTSATSVGFYHRPATTEPLLTTGAGTPFAVGSGDQILWDLSYAVD